MRAKNYKPNPIRKDNELMSEAMIAEKAIERRNNIVPNKTKSASKLNIRTLL